MLILAQQSGPFFENPEAHPIPFLNSRVADACISCLDPGSLEIAADPGTKEEIDAAPDLNPKTVKKISFVNFLILLLYVLTSLWC